MNSKTPNTAQGTPGDSEKKAVHPHHGKPQQFNYQPPQHHPTTNNNTGLMIAIILGGLFLIATLLLAAFMMLSMSVGQETVTDSTPESITEKKPSAVIFDSICRSDSGNFAFISAADIAAEKQYVAFYRGPAVNGNIESLNLPNSFPSKGDVAAPQDINLVACLYPNIGEITGETCSAISGDSQIELNLHEVTYSVRIYATQSGKLLDDTSTISGIAQCPAVAIYNENDPRLYATPNVEELAQYLQTASF